MTHGALPLSRWVDRLWDGPRGKCVHAKGSRRVFRVLGTHGTYFAKGGIADKRHELQREARIHATLEQAGLPVVPLLASGVHDGITWIVTEPAPGRPASDVLEEASRAGDAALIHATLQELARLVARLHAAGFSYPDLTLDHVFLADEAAGGGGPTLIDLARAEGPRPVTLRHQARDLAALLCSIPLSVAGRVARTRLVRDAAGLRGPELRPLLERIDKAIRKLSLRTRWRHGYADVSPVLCQVAEANAGKRKPLFDALHGASWMKVVRRLPDRENRSFAGSDGRRYFMKTYPPVKQGFSPAYHERVAIELFARSGIPVCREEAYGEDVERGSFVVVRGCEGEPLDDLLRAGVTPAERHWLAVETGRIWRRMRLANLRHRDAYACHVFAARKPAADGSPAFELGLIDLTRAGPAPFPRERWFVKDASQLWHGVPWPPVTRTDAVRWLRAYFAVPKLTEEAKRFARRVASKEGRIAARRRRKANRPGDGA